MKNKFVPKKKTSKSVKNITKVSIIEDNFFK